MQLNWSACSASQLSTDHPSFRMQDLQSFHSSTRILRGNNYKLLKKGPWTKAQREEKMGTPAMVRPASTTNIFPVKYEDESCMRQRTREVIAGSDVPYVFSGTVFLATFFNQSFCIRPSVISDLNSPGAIAFTLILQAPNSSAITCSFPIGKSRKMNRQINSFCFNFRGHYEESKELNFAYNHQNKGTPTFSPHKKIPKLHDSSLKINPQHTCIGMYAKGCVFAHACTCQHDIYY